MAKDNQPTREHPSDPPKSVPLATPAGFYDTFCGMAYVPQEIAAGATGQVILYEPHQGESTATLVHHETTQEGEIFSDLFLARLTPRTLEDHLKDKSLPIGQREFIEKYRHAQSQPKSTGARPYWGGMAPWGVGDDDALMEGDFTP